VLLNYHIGRLVLSSLCVGDLVRLVSGGVRFAGFSAQNADNYRSSSFACGKSECTNKVFPIIPVPS
jgi:hypothetical protein